MGKTGEQFITGSFSLRQPTKKKQAVIDECMNRYTEGAAFILDHAERNLVEIKEKSRYYCVDKNGEVAKKPIYRETNVSSNLPPLSALDEIHLFSAIKEGLINDVSSALASYFALVAEDENTGFPSSYFNPRISADERDRRREKNYIESLDWLITPEIDQKGYDTASHAINRIGNKKKGKRHQVQTRPIYYSRSRDFKLLADTERQLLYAYLPLLPKKNEFDISTCINDQRLIDINTGEVFTTKRPRKNALILPIEMGNRKLQYHKYIQPCLEGRAKYKAAKLLRRDLDTGYRYYLNVSIAVDTEPVYEPQTVLGIDRGIIFTAAYGIVDMDGRVVTQGHYDDGLRNLQVVARKAIAKRQAQGKTVTLAHHRGQQRTEILHHLVNDILDVAEEYESAIVMEHLNIQVKSAWVSSSWRKFHDILKYKANLRGVPVWRDIFPQHTSQICIHCGNNNVEHKRNGKPVVCTECGTIEHADEAAGVNIARRIFYKAAKWKKKSGYFGFHRAMSNNQLNGIKPNPYAEFSGLPLFADPC